MREFSNPERGGRVRTIWASAKVLILICAMLAGASVRAEGQTKSKPKARPQPESSDDQASAKIDPLLHEAEDALNRHDFPAAIKSLKEVVSLQPDMSPAWFNLGYAYTALRQNDDAIAAYRKTIELQGDLFEARLNLGILLIEMNKPKDALEHLEKAATLKSDNARAHLYYGRALAADGQADAATKQFQETLRLDPNLAIAHFDLAQVSLSQKHFDDARAEFEKAANLDAKLPQAQLGLALSLEGLNRSADAAAAFEKYLAQKPDDLETRFHLARLNLQAGQNEAALENLQKVYQAKPGIAGLAAALGDVSALLKKLPDSEKYYREALVQTPRDADLHRALAKTLLDEEKLQEAESEFRTALKIDSRNQEALHGLAATLYLQKRYPEAIPLLEAQVKAPNAPAAAYFVLATCYDHLRDNRNALAAYERYLELEKDEKSDQVWQAQQRAKLLRRMVQK